MLYCPNAVKFLWDCYNNLENLKVRVLFKVAHLGAGGWGWVLLGWTGLVLPATTQNPARLVYGSAALVASLRGQHCHFATLPNRVSPTFMTCGDPS